MCFGPSINPAAGAAFGGAGGPPGGGTYYPQQPPRAPDWTMAGGPFGFGGGGFGASPWLPFLFNLFSSYGAPQQPHLGAPRTPTPPQTGAAPATPAAGGMVTLSDPAAPPAASPTNAVQPGRDPTTATLVPLRDPVTAPFAPSTVAAAPGANARLAGMFSSLPANSFAGPWARVLGT